MAPERGICVKRKQVLPGRQCSSTDMCISESVCRNGTCQCEENRIIKAGRCEIRKIVQAGEQCKTGDECLGNSTCNGDICECSAGEVVRGGRCQKRMTTILISQQLFTATLVNFHFPAGGSCMKGEICDGGSFCDSTSKICSCVRGEEIKRGKCIKIVRKNLPIQGMDWFILGLAVLSTTKLISPSTVSTSTMQPRINRYRCFQNSDCVRGAVCKNNACLAFWGSVVGKEVSAPSQILYVLKASVDVCPVIEFLDLLNHSNNYVFQEDDSIDNNRSTYYLNSKDNYYCTNN
uniref:EB domain-containing protein n=1 Tax=Heterorhabditis bacteriophora TaxID=37862 RepID=A0A1I7X0H0_HETBA